MIDGRCSRITSGASGCLRRTEDMPDRGKSAMFPRVVRHRALVLSYLNRPEEAIRSARQAIRLSPFDPTMFSFCQALALAELAAGRYEAGLPWAEEALCENAGMPALRLKLSLCGYLGRNDEARACLSRASEFHCEPTIAGIMRALPKGVVPELAARVTEGLRKAGIPEG